jgi:hypothetical protein
MKTSRSKKKVKDATERCTLRTPAGLMDKAQDRAQDEEPDFRKKRLFMKNSFLCWLLEQYGSGKFKVTP